MPEVLRADGRRVALSSLLQLVDLEALDGRITTERGRIDLQEGRVVGAQLGDHAGVGALLELLVVPLARIEIVEESPAAEGPPLGELMGLVVESCRLADEWARLAPLVLAPPVPVCEDPALAEVLAGVDGRRALWEIVDDAPVLVVQVVDPLGALLATRVLEVVGRRAMPVLVATPGGLELPPADGSPPESPPIASAGGGDPPDATYDELVESGRRFVRARQLDEARERFERALHLRPDDSIAAQNLRRIAALQEAS
ncbi:MAG: DUF4388 domain-containing protein [Alphaproteobacteria bacterium]|nr:DUF4388 domain-containing protein [Alphaproteobacteria bacterium]